MPNKVSIWSSFAKREIIILFLVGLLLFVMGLSGEALHFEFLPAALLKGAQDFGLSLIEAALVMTIIDLRASREQIEKSLELIQKATDESKALIADSIKETIRTAGESLKMTRQAIDSVFNSVYQKNVPPELVDHYESMVFDRKFFRRKDKYVYKLRVPRGAGSEDFMNVDVFHEFTMENLTDEDADYEFQCETSFVANTPAKHVSQYFELHVNNAQIQVGPGQVVDRPGYKALVLSHTTPIPAGQKRGFKVRWQTARRVRDAEILMTIWPSDGLEVAVDWDSGLDVSVNALHPKDLDKVLTGNNATAWTLNSGMVPGQGVCLWWEPLPAP
jgi:hypothetical protein